LAKYVTAALRGAVARVLDLLLGGIGREWLDDVVVDAGSQGLDNVVLGRVGLSMPSRPLDASTDAVT
jgi:hypothetical protein